MADSTAAKASTIEKTDGENKPEEFIIDPMMSIHTELDDLNIEVSKLTEEEKKTGTGVSENTVLLQGILKELKDRRPKGKVLRVNNIAPDQPNLPGFPDSKNGFFLINAYKYLIDVDAKKFRAYVVYNPGPNNLYVGFNAARSPEVDLAAEDIDLDDKFDFITPGQDTHDFFDTEEIYHLSIWADPTTGLGPQKFRAKLTY